MSTKRLLIVDDETIVQEMFREDVNFVNAVNWSNQVPLLKGLTPSEFFYFFGGGALTIICEE